MDIHKMAFHKVHRTEHLSADLATGPAILQFNDVWSNSSGQFPEVIQIDSSCNQEQQLNILGMS